MISIKERELILKWNEEGKDQQEIADLLKCHQTSVGRFLNKNKQKGILENLPRSGRPTKLTKATLSQLKEKISTKIKRANDKFCSVRTVEIRKVIHQEVGKEYSMRHIERIMHQLGFSLVTPRSQHIRHDQEKVDLFRDEFKKKFNRSTWGMK